MMTENLLTKMIIKLCFFWISVLIKRVNGNFETSVYRKPTITVFLQILKVFYRLFTKGFIFSLLFRYFNICSSYQFFHAELEKFKKLLLQNGYPKFFIDRCVKTFLDKMISPPLKVQTPTVSKLLIPIVLPCTGNHANQIRQQLHKLFSSVFPQVQLRVIFKPICRLSNFFHFKYRIPLNLR